MNLSEFYNKRKEISTDFRYRVDTDKGTTHDYINGYYNKVLTPLKNKQINFLEIGIYDGESIGFWRAWFDSANIFGLDPTRELFWKWCNSLPNVKIEEIDAYTQKALDMFDDGFFDFIIDDGPHTIESQLFSVKHWTKKLKVGGILAIEDIQLEDHIKIIVSEMPSNYVSNIYDIRKNKNRYDDIIIEFIRKS